MTPHAAGFGPGTVVSGVYRIVRPLSEGGMGAVYVAEHVTTRKQRALKMMHGELLGDPTLRERFVQEAQIGGRIESEHVVEVVDAGFDEQLRAPWIAMELLDGEPLAARIERGPVSAAETHAIFQQLCHALAAAHAASIVHRDLKPDNVFIARARHVGAAFTVKVLDFGIAKIVAEAKQATRQATAAIGTPLWMAPEQTELGTRISPASDVWALGLIAFRMLTGRYYWLEAYRNLNNVGAILTEMVVKPLVPASQRANELGAAHLLPPGFDGWFARCVDRDPSRRFADAGQAFATLAPLLVPQPSGTQIGWPQQQAQMTPATAQYGSGTMLGAPPPGMQPSVPLHTPPHVAQAGTPAGIPMNTPPPRATKKSSGVTSFVVGLGSVLVVGAIAVFAIRAASDKSGDGASGDPSVQTKSKAVAQNKWVRVDPTKKTWYLGVENDDVAPTIRGYRPARKIAAPFAAFEIQQHEVTWAEIDPWLANQKGHKPPKDIPGDSAKRDQLPATGLGFHLASSYCKSIGGNLPTEEQWEFAARGVERRKFAWGKEAIDLRGTRVFAGSKATLVPVMTNEQDKTPGDDTLFDMMGNAQEWTLDVYQDDFPEQDEGWAQNGGVTFRAVRGLPIAEAADPALMSTMTAAYREPVCATGGCAPGGSGGSGDPVVFVRSAFTTPPPDASTARTTLSKALVEAKSDLGACLDKGEAPHGTLLKVDYTLPLKKTPVCRASDGYDDPMECCTTKICEHAPHHVIKYDPAKVVIGTPAEGFAGGAESAASCAKGVLEKKLALVKWGDSQDEWGASVWISRLEVKPPKSVAWIGFRCVRGVKKD